ncbi:hypothetical protein [Trinickia mobilis]|uniref:hypothetical protein n=1 Tax=Trinickia mobilis TaxID=2816356 RepID=UPI001A8E0788|nr:hypothetical protein [Trinickia mobilis]
MDRAARSPKAGMHRGGRLAVARCQAVEPSEISGAADRGHGATDQQKRRAKDRACACKTSDDTLIPVESQARDYRASAKSGSIQFSILAQFFWRIRTGFAQSLCLPGFAAIASARTGFFRQPILANFFGKTCELSPFGP